MSTAGVVEALRSTSKGRLKYGSQLENCSPKERLRLLDEWSSPPPLSPEAVKYLTERVNNLSLQNEGKREPKSETPSVLSENSSFVTRKNVAMRATYVEEDTQHTSHSKYVLEVPDDDVAMETTYVVELANESVIAQGEREQQEYEQSLDDKLMEELHQRMTAQREWFKKKRERLRAKHIVQYREEKAKRERDAQAMKKRQLEESKTILDKVTKRMEEVTQSYRLHEELLEAKLRSGEEQKLEIQKKIIEGRRMKRLKLLQQCRDQSDKVVKMIKQVAAMLQSCSHRQYISKPVIENYEKMNLIAREILSALVSMETAEDPDEKTCDMLTTKVSSLLSRLAEISATINEANARGEREKKEHEELLRKTAEKLEQEQKAKEEEEKKKKEDAAKLTPPNATTVIKKDPSDGASGQSPRQPSGLVMPTSALETYNRLLDLLSKTVASCTELSSSKDPAVKKYRFDLQKSINITMNSISATSGEDLLEKIVRLKKLFGGEPVTVTGRTLTINDHPEAKFYCYNLFAKKLVKHGEDQVASNSNAAFPIAAVAIGLWSLFPDLGDLILAHFYTVCPILVPMYVEQTDGTLPPEMMKLQGFRVSNDGAVESEDIFLKRMRGVVRLYAAIVQTPQLPLGGQPRPPHPHSLESGWTWMARMLNMEPHPTLMATALGDFLEVAGHAMMERFGRQFRKLLLVLCKEYVPMIEKVTPPTQKGPLSRLTQLLEDCIAAGKIPQPKGILSEEFWRSRSHGMVVA